MTRIILQKGTNDIDPEDCSFKYPVIFLKEDSSLCLLLLQVQANIVWEASVLKIFLGISK